MDMYLKTLELLHNLLKEKVPDQRPCRSLGRSFLRKQEDFYTEHLPQ